MFQIVETGGSDAFILLDRGAQFRQRDNGPNRAMAFRRIARSRFYPVAFRVHFRQYFSNRSLPVGLATGGFYFFLVGVNYITQRKVSYPGVVRLQPPVGWVCLQLLFPVPFSPIILSQLYFADAEIIS